MKSVVEEINGFKPIRLSIDIESVEELVALLEVFGTPYSVAKAATEPPAFDKYESNDLITKMLTQLYNDLSIKASDVQIER